MYLSLGIRFKANVEALNMSETVGNVSRHRRVPIITEEDNEYRLIYVPAISGESIAHAIQWNLVRVAKQLYGENAPIDPWSERGEFIKFGDSKHLTKKLKDIIGQKIEVEKKQHMFEVTAIRESIVADVGGFLYAENPPVRRTSPLYVSYAIPVEDAIEVTAIEAQVHARQVPVGITKEEERQAQMLYYVEIASAIYGVTISLDVDSIGKTSMVKVEPAVSEEERRIRLKATLGALALTMGQKLFGAKRSRFTPILEVTNAIATISDPLPFNVSPPQKRNYIEDTIERASKFKEMTEKLGVKTDISMATYKYPAFEGDKKSLEELFLWIASKLGV
ncbi:type I-A CRISPR-associated protein Cas7/Csa2 [Candidatus Woesearchaeota archaeon]|nr:MAG: type I-A CRISPR-associated protein Cas7/Csa2 [Candidatus Woesearchaeota archaeon]